MVGIVVVSHSQKLSEGVLDLVKTMSPDAKICAAGGRTHGLFGTSAKRIKKAIMSVYSEDGVVVLMDLGSAIMVTEEVVKELGMDNIVIVDAPIAEGAVAAAFVATDHAPLSDVKAAAIAAKSQIKF